LASSGDGKTYPNSSMHTGFIPHIKLGKLVRFRELEVEDWVKQRSRQGRKQAKYGLRI